MVEWLWIHQSDIVESWIVISACKQSIKKAEDRLLQVQGYQERFCPQN